MKEIPNYSKSSGKEWVLNSNYEKYQEGYCLEENKILSDEEIFKRGIIQYMEKKFLFEMKVYWHFENADLTSSARKPEYYFSRDMNFSELKKISFLGSSSKYLRNYLKKVNFFFKVTNATENKLRTFLKLDLENMYAGFSPLFLEYSAFDDDFDLYTNQSFLLKIEKEKRKKFLFKVNKIDLGLDKQRLNDYDEVIFKHENNLPNNWEDKSFMSLPLIWEIDNCGNVDFNVEEKYKMIEPHIGQAG